MMDRKELMVSHRRYARALLLGCAALALALPTWAAQVGVETRPDYTRLNFTFDQPARLTKGGSGTSLVLDFDQPVPESTATLGGQLSAVATGITRSPDGKRLTIALKEAYRTRQFTSGNGVGVDILSPRAPEPPVAPPPAEAAPTPPPAPSPAEKPVETAAPNFIVPPPAPAQPAPPPKPPAPTPKAPPPAPKDEAAAPNFIVPPPAPAQPAPPPKPPAPTPKAPILEPEPAPTPEPTAIRTEPPKILSTAPGGDVVIPTPTEPVAVVEDEGPPSPDVPPAAALDGADATRISAPAPQNPVLTTKPEPTRAVEAPAPPPEAMPEPEPAPVAATPAMVDTTPFLVGVRTTKTGTEMQFPWKARTAAAVFERGNEIWLVFSSPVDMNTALLRTVLPTAVIRVDQFAYDGASVLRLTTDGKLHATAQQPKGSYAWKILLSPSIPRATLDVPVSGERDAQGRDYLQLNAFDIAEPLRFYDPTVGDLLVIIPTFELGRGVNNIKTTPELSVLATQQGIAVASLRDGLTTERDRTGVQIYGPQSLSVSENLPVMAAQSVPVPGVSTTANVMIPYEQWYVPVEDFTEAHMLRQRAINTANAASRPAAIMEMVHLYLGHGFALEALGYLQRLQQTAPDYYREHKIALLTAAANLMGNRIEGANEAIAAPELADLPEAKLWREAISLVTPPPSTAQRIQQASADALKTPAENATDPAQATEAALTEALPPVPPPSFDFLKYNRNFIRYYPPRIRQKLAVMGADFYAGNDQNDKALATYDTLNTDGILRPVQPYAELTIATIAANKGKTTDALTIFDRLAKQHKDLYVQARARYDAIMLRYATGQLTTDETTDALERLRLIWRGDGLERELLFNLASIYEKEKQYANALRTWKALLMAFPGDRDTLTIAGDMTEMFEDLFLNGLADDMPPLKSLALFYEFRELTPIGPRGDDIIQKLADRLAAVDLIDRATQLLEHQIKFRVSGAARAQVGARLALLYLLNKQPQRALEVLEITNYGNTDGQLRRQRMQLAAQALAGTGRPEQGLAMLAGDDTKQGAKLRMEILWEMQDWSNVVNEAEGMLAKRPNLTDPLSTSEAELLLKLSLAYAFEGDALQLKFLRDYYMGLLGDTPYKEIFEFITNDTAPLDTDDFNLVAQQISRTESFLDSFRKTIAEGRLSDAVK